MNNISGLTYTTFIFQETVWIKHKSHAQAKHLTEEQPKMYLNP